TKEGTLTTAVGASLDFDRTLTPANSTSKTYYTVSDTENAEITSAGVFTAKKAGEYTVTATVKNSKTAATLATTEAKVVVKDVVLKEVKQASATTLTAVFAGDVSKVKATDIVITRKADNVVFPVSKIAVDAVDKTKATLTVFSKIADGKEYTVKYGDTTVEFKATDGKAASLVVEPTTIPYNTETEIKVVGKDAQGITVFEAMLNDKDSKLDMKIETTQGYLVGNKLVLLAKGNTAKVTATLHTYEYNTDGTEKDVLKTEATITAVDPEAVSLTGKKYTIAETLDWKKELNTKISLSEKNSYLFYELKDSKGKDVTKDYTKVESSDTNTLLVSFVEGGKVKLLPVKEGTAYVLVKDAKDNVIASFAVTVVAERKATAILLEPASLTVSNKFEYKTSTKVTVKDQFGNDMSNPKVTVTEKHKPTNGDLTLPKYENGRVIVESKAKGVTGTYVYEIKSGDAVRMLTVSVQTVDDNVSSTYELTLGNDKVDTTITNTFDGNAITIDASVQEKKNGLPVNNVKITKIEVVTSGGEVKFTTDKVATGSAIALNDTKATITVAKVKDNSTEVEKLLGAGTYVVKATFKKDSNDVTVTRSFVVEDKQPGLTAEVKKTTLTGNTLTDAIKAAVTKGDIVLKCNDVELKADAIISTESKALGKNHAGVKVKVQITVKGKDNKEYKVPAEVTLANTITLN
ncbi:Ig-like domain-containing protein, partial [Acetivibrio ethanolgignens]|uniref:Ig-like domain-containing protein n=1 Tax=Acetivibrio ethanolgignens TaxID=290052 RepID=UPI0011CBD1CC